METEAQLPHHWNLSRFLDVLGHPGHLAEMHECFDRMVQRLVGVVPHWGRRLAGDATAWNARRGDATRQESETARGWPPPTGGRTESLDADGRVERVVEWFGSKLPLLVDSRHEVVLADALTAPAVGDNERIPP